VLAKEIVRSNKAITRLTTNKAHMMSISNSLTEQLAMVRVAGALKKSTGVMTSMSKVIKLPEMQKTMMEMSKEMEKAGLIDEMVGDAVDGAVDGEDIEEEMDEQINQVLDEIAGDTLAALPNARRNKAAQQAEAPSQEEDEADADLQARLEAIKT
ncbi:Snf7 family, partial [Dunaliella salina]